MRISASFLAFASSVHFTQTPVFWRLRVKGLRDSSVTTYLNELLNQPTEHIKLESEPSNSFVPIMLLQLFRPHHSPYATSAATWLTECHTRPSKYVYLARVKLEHLERDLEDPMNDELLHRHQKVTRCTATHPSPRLP